MKRILVVLGVLVVLVAAPPARADVTVSSTMTVKGGPMNMEGQTVVLIKGTRMRNDMNMMGMSMSTIADTSTHQVYMLNHSTKEAELTDMVKTMESIGGGMMSMGQLKVDVKPLNETRTLLGVVCNGYTVSIVAQTSMGENQMTMTMSGSTWVAKDAPGLAEYLAIMRQSPLFAPQPGGGAKPGQMNWVSEMSKAFGDIGIPYLTELTMGIQGPPEIADAMAQMGAMTMTMAVTSVTTTPISDDKFRVPADYTVKKK
jgi:hypothetical protein